ncbi:VirB2 family type IV secretion system major pilin TrwL [Bartonella sp. B12(2025)]
MKQFNIIQTKVHNKIITTRASIVIFFMTYPVYSQAKGLERVKTVLENVRTQLNVIIPIAATIILLCLAVSYAGRFIEKSTFVRWAIGVIIAGSAFEIANMLFGKP